MGSGPVIVIEIRTKGSSQRAFMEHDHMIEAFAANRPNHPPNIGSLPRRARSRQNFANAHVSQLFREVIAKDSITVARLVARELVKGEGLSQLLSRPLRGRGGRDTEGLESRAVMGQ